MFLFQEVVAVSQVYEVGNISWANSAFVWPSERNVFFQSTNHHLFMSWINYFHPVLTNHFTNFISSLVTSQDKDPLYSSCCVIFPKLTLHVRVTWKGFALKATLLEALSSRMCIIERWNSKRPLAALCWLVSFPTYGSTELTLLYPAFTSMCTASGNRADEEETP